MDKLATNKQCVAIFGTGQAGQQAYDFCSAVGVDVKFFIDDYKNGIFCDIPIISRSLMDEKHVDTVIVGYGQKGNLDFNGVPLVRLHNISPYTMSENEINKTLYLSCEYVCKSGVDGNIAEFGTNSGRTASVLALATHNFSNDKRLLCFDSFEGLPPIELEIDKQHRDVINGVWHENAFCDLDEHELSELLSTIIDTKRIGIHKGWFKESLSYISKQTKFALVHIDADLYASAVDVLDYIFANALVSDGCVVLFDDFNCSCASNELGERKAWGEMVEKYKIKYSDGGWYGWAGWRFIVHEYDRGANA